MRVLMSVAVMAGCGGTQAEPASASAKTAEDPKLNEVQAECRAEMSAKLGTLDAVFGPTCEKPSMSTTLVLFDMATFDGFNDADALTYAYTLSCLCAKTTCSDLVNREMLKAVSARNGSARNAGIVAVQNKLAGHSCLSSAVAGEIYKLGFDCGLVNGEQSRTIRERRTRDLAVYIDDKSQAGKVQVECDAEAQRLKE